MPEKRDLNLVLAHLIREVVPQREVVVQNGLRQIAAGIRGSSPKEQDWRPWRAAYIFLERTIGGPLMGWQPGDEWKMRTWHILTDVEPLPEATQELSQAELAPVSPAPDPTAQARMMTARQAIDERRKELDDGPTD